MNIDQLNVIGCRRVGFYLDRRLRFGSWRPALVSIALLAAICGPTGAFEDNNDLPMPPNDNDNGLDAATRDARNAVLDKKMLKPMKLQFYTWTRGDSPVRMGKFSDQLCLLSGVSGKFAGAGEAVSLYVDDGAAGGPQWMLGGHSGQDQLRATAVCVSYREFAMPVETTKNLRVRFSYEVAADGCRNQTYTFPDGHDATAPFLSGLSGKFSGAAERANAFRTKVEASLEVRACSEGGITATGIGVVSPTGLIKFRTPVARDSNAKTATFAYAFDGPPKQGWFDTLTGADDAKYILPGPWILPADEAFCGLVRVGGKFQGYGEEASVTVTQNSDGRRWWRMFVGSQAAGSGTVGAVRCLARDQR